MNEATMTKYSICITHYNNRSTIEGSLHSIFAQVSGDFEIIMVDNKSNDGSAEILRKYASEGKIKLVERKCSRGLGRQVALENSTGEYIISGLDMDDVYRPALHAVLQFYHKMTEGTLLAVVDGGATMVGPRNLLTSLGGWQDLQFRENWELSRRAAKNDKHRWTIFPIILSMTPKERTKSTRSSLGYRYIRYRENLRVGHKQFDEGEGKGLSQEAVWLAARFSTLFLPRYQADYRFTAVDEKDFVDSRRYWPADDDIEKERKLYRALLGKEI